jgi:hypothetical protein
MVEQKTKVQLFLFLFCSTAYLPQLTHLLETIKP